MDQQAVLGKYSLSSSDILTTPRGSGYKYVSWTPSSVKGNWRALFASFDSVHSAQPGRGRSNSVHLGQYTYAFYGAVAVALFRKGLVDIGNFKSFAAAMENRIHTDFPDSTNKHSQTQTEDDTIYCDSSKDVTDDDLNCDSDTNPPPSDWQWLEVFEIIQVNVEKIGWTYSKVISVINLDGSFDVSVFERGDIWEDSLNWSTEGTDWRRLNTQQRCTNCVPGRDCGRCRNCADKKNFNGPGIRKQKCILFPLIPSLSRGSEPSRASVPSYSSGPARDRGSGDCCALWTLEARLLQAMVTGRF